jgi:4'-phosphopantetheinyl transferase
VTIALARVSLARAARGSDALARLLAPEERARLLTMRVPKRAADHLAGRLAARRALAAIGIDLSGVSVGVDVGARAGAPLALRDGAPIDGVWLSISHGAGSALAVASDDAPVGIDIERVEPRPIAMLEDAFAPGELERWSRALDERDPDRIATIAWCAKEACAKVAATGLRAPLSAYEALAIDPRGPAPPSRPLSLAAMREVELVIRELGALPAHVLVRDDLAVVLVRATRTRSERRAP